MIRQYRTPDSDASTDVLLAISSCSLFPLQFFTKRLQRFQKYFISLCNLKEENRTPLESARQYKGRRRLKGSRRPARVERLTLFRGSRATRPTSAFPPSLLPPNFQTGYVKHSCYGLSAGHNRRHRPAFAQKMAPLQTSGTSLLIADHDAPAERPRNLETLRGLPRHILLDSFYSRSLGPNFSIQGLPPGYSDS